MYMLWDVRFSCQKYVLHRKLCTSVLNNSSRTRIKIPVHELRQFLCVNMCRGWERVCVCVFVCVCVCVCVCVHACMGVSVSVCMGNCVYRCAPLCVWGEEGRGRCANTHSTMFLAPCRLDLKTKPFKAMDTKYVAQSQLCGVGMCACVMNCGWLFSDSVGSLLHLTEGVTFF